VPYDPALMRRILNCRPSPAMVVACIALIVALGGTGYAAIKLPRNSVGNKQLRANAVTSGKVRNGSLTAKDFQSSALKRGPRGPAGPKGDSAPGGIPRVGFASRDPVTVSAAAIPVGGTPVDLVALSGTAGSAGYGASSGAVVASGPSRLIANGQAVILNAAAGPASSNVSCRIVVIGSETRVAGTYVNAAIPAASGYVPVAVSAGVDIESGSYDVRLQCYSGEPAMQFHRGNLTVSIAPR
jgi:hypothetical protein